MKLHQLPKRASARKRQRVGRGHGSGWVKTSGRGQKGQKSRAGCTITPAFQGGGISMLRRAPKLGGFTSVNRVEYTPVNLGQLNVFPEGTEVTIEELKKVGIMRSTEKRVKILARGELEKKLKIHAHAWSAATEEKANKIGAELIKIS